MMVFSMDSRRQDLLTFFAGLEQAFGFFGGVPYELLFDQMKAVIIEDERLEGNRGGNLLSGLRAVGQDPRPAPPTLRALSLAGFASGVINRPARKPGF
jgi:hypothetical protein